MQQLFKMIVATSGTSAIPESEQQYLDRLVLLFSRGADKMKQWTFEQHLAALGTLISTLFTQAKETDAVDFLIENLGRWYRGLEEPDTFVDQTRLRVLLRDIMEMLRQHQ